MITKYITFLNEKLSDKLSGFNEEELKFQYEKGEITIEKYLQICNKYHISLPPEDILKQEYLSNKISIRKYLYLAQTYNYNLPEIELNNELKEKEITVETYLYLSGKFLDKLPNEIEIKQMLLNNMINVYFYLKFTRLYKIKSLLSDSELKQYYLDKKITIQEYIDCVFNFDNKPLLTSDELKKEYIDKNIGIEYYFMIMKKLKFNIPNIISNKILKLTIKEYKNDEITFENLMNFLIQNNLEMSKEEIINIFIFKIKTKKIDLNNIFYYNDIYNLDLDNDEIFQCLGFQHSFDNATEFIEYILNNYENIRNNRTVIIKDGKEKMISLHAYEYDGLINLNYERITKVLDYWFKLNKKEINILLNKIINKYYKFNVDFNAV
jgi:hypothetical protein